MARPALNPPRTPVPWSWALAGTVMGAVAALLLFAPARWLAALVAWGTQGHLVLEDARGTVWRGSARGVVAGGRGSRDAMALPSRLAWTLEPGLRGLDLSLHAPCCMPAPVRVRIQPTAQGLNVSMDDVATSRWPAQLLAGLGTPWNTLQLEGRLQLSTHGLHLRWTPQQLQVQGQAQLLALDMASRLTTLRPLGSYRLRLVGATPAATLQLETLEGGLRLTGTGQWQAAHLRFSGEATAAPEHATVLANLLNLLGRREGARSIITLG